MLSFADYRLEKVLYLQTVPRGTRGRKRKLYTQTCDQIWLSLLSFPRASLSLSRSVFARSLVVAVQERDETCVAIVLSTKPSLDRTTVSLRVQGSRSICCVTRMNIRQR